jgi:hypothetical protein
MRTIHFIRCHEEMGRALKIESLNGLHPPAKGARGKGKLHAGG